VEEMRRRERRGEEGERKGRGRGEDRVNKGGGGCCNVVEGNRT
jgi:hypothetical protein